MSTPATHEGFTCCLCGGHADHQLDCAPDEIVCDDCAHFDEIDRCEAAGIEPPTFGEFMEEVQEERERLGL